MRRVIFFLFLLFCSGICLGLITAFDIKLLLLILIILLTISIVRYLNGRKIHCHIYLLVFCCGIFLSSRSISDLKNVSNSLSDHFVTLNGQIFGDAATNGNVSVFTLYGCTISSDDGKCFYNRKVKVVDYRNDKKYIIPFNYVTIKGEFKKNEIYKNSGTFMGDRLLFKDGICGTVILDYNFNISSKECKERQISRFLYNYRTNVEKVIDIYSNDDSRNILKGILFGDTSGIDDYYKSFQESGTVHIFAVSGYNIWLVFHIISSIFVFIKNTWIKTLLVIGILGIYTAMSGFAASALRAFLMASTVLLGRVMKRDSDAMTSLGAAGILMLSFNPLQIMDIGFLLSFISVLSIIIIMPKLNSIRFPLHGKIMDAVLLTLSVQIGITPIVIYYFNSFPLLSVISNIIVVPLVSAITVLSIFLYIFHYIMPFLSILAGSIINLLVRVILHITEFISSLPYSNLNIISPGIFQIALYYIVLAVFLGLLKIDDSYRKRAGYGIILAILFFMASYALPSNMVINFIDVGQGDCILITSPDKKHILIDGGGKPQNLYSSVDVGRDVLLPYLYKHGVNKIDLIISTHSHDDHIGGLLPVIEDFNYERIVCGQYGDNRLHREFEFEDDVISGVEEGDVIKVGKYIELYILNPSNMEEDENDCSIVTQLVYKDFSALFTGDISADVEKGLNVVSADILKIPHHGSAASLDQYFLERVNPQVAVICVGDNNYGHPSDTIIKTIEEKGIKLYRTDRDGEITITTNGREFWVSTFM